MLKQQQSKKQPVKFPPITTKANDSNGFEPNRRALSSAKNSDSRASDLEKQLFSKLEDYDMQVRKEKRLEKIEGRRKAKQSEPVVGKRQAKRSSTSHIEKTLKETQPATQIGEQPSTHHSKTTTEIESTPLLSNKENHTFLTNTRVEKQQQPTQQELREYGEVELQQDCPFTDQQMNRLYREYEKEDCFIPYTSSKQIKQLNRMLNHCDQSLEDLVKDTQRMMKEVGFCLTQEELAEGKSSEPN